MSIGRFAAAADSFAGQTVRLAIGRAFGKLLSFLGFILIARLLGPTQYGGFSFALSLGSLLVFIPNLGVDPLFSREVPAGRARPSEMLGLMLVLKSGASALFLAVYLSLVFLTPTSNPARAAAVFVGLALTLLAVGQTWRTVLITSGRAGLAGILEVIAPAVFVLATLALVASFPTVSHAALAFLSGQLAAAAVGGVVVLRGLRIEALPRTIGPYRRVLTLAVPLMLIWFLSDLYLRIDMTVLNYLRGDGQTGLYGASYRLIDGVSSGAMVVSSICLPRMARAWSVGTGAWQHEWKHACRLLLQFVIPAAALLFVGAGPIILLLYGPAFGEAAASLRVLGPAAVFLCLGFIYGSALTSMGQEWAQMVITAIALLLNLALNVLWIPTHGGVGAAYATLVSALAYLVMAHLAIRSGLATKPRMRVPATSSTAAPANNAE